MSPFRVSLCILMGVGLPAAGACQASAQEPGSPRLQQLGQEIQSGAPRAVEDFWAEIQRSGSPLVEPIDVDTSVLLVTFLWRDPGDDRNVVVYSGHTNTLYGFTSEDLARHSMRRLAGTDVWYISYLLPADARFTTLLGSARPSGLRFSSMRGLPSSSTVGARREPATSRWRRWRGEGRRPAADGGSQRADHRLRRQRRRGQGRGGGDRPQRLSQRELLRRHGGAGPESDPVSQSGQRRVNLSPRPTAAGRQPRATIFGRLRE